MLSSRLFSFTSPLLTLAFAACGNFGAGTTTSDLGGFGGAGGQLTVSTGGGGGGGTGGGPQQFTYQAYCGISECIPGVADACEGAGGTSSGTGGADPTGGSGSTGGAGSTAATGGAGSTSSTGGAGAMGAGSGAGGAGGMAAGEFGCSIINEGGEPLSTCAQVGTKQDGEVCSVSNECANGLGCVLAVDPGGDGGAGPQAIGQCKPYCCSDVEAGCPDETTYCALRPMFDGMAEEDTGAAALEVPVCVPTKPCTLLGGDCGPGETCTIVRESTGTTSCVPVGDGTTCQACPCAADHICSYATGTCLKLCAPNLETCPGAGALCQGGMIASVGVCIGGDAACE